MHGDGGGDEARQVICPRCGAGAFYKDEDGDWRCLSCNRSPQQAEHEARAREIDREDWVQAGTALRRRMPSHDRLG